jgi:hypothetical protein
VTAREWGLPVFEVSVSSDVENHTCGLLRVRMHVSVYRPRRSGPQQTEVSARVLSATQSSIEVGLIGDGPLLPDRNMDLGFVDNAKVRPKRPTHEESV